MVHASIVHSLLPELFFPLTYRYDSAACSQTLDLALNVFECYVLRSVTRTVKTCMLHLDLALNVFECYMLRSVIRTVKTCMLHFPCHKQKTTEG